MKLSKRQLEDEVNLLAGMSLEHGGLAHAYLLGAQHSLEWLSGGETPHKRFLDIISACPVPLVC